MRYSLVVPYFKTPEITRITLRSILRFSRGQTEVIVVDNAPGGPASALFDAFEGVRVIANPGAPQGSDGNFHALEVGLSHASNDLVGLLHSDVVFVREGWDLECFGRLESEGLAALGTFEREADPFAPLASRLADHWRHWRHVPRPGPDAPGKLMVHFLLTRRSTLVQAPDLLAQKMRGAVPRLLAQGPVEVLSRLEMGRILWHASNLTSLLTGQMDDPVLMARYRRKRRRLLADRRLREALGPVLPAE